MLFKNKLFLKYFDFFLFYSTQPPWAICTRFGASHQVCRWNKLVLYVGMPGKLSSKYFPGNFWRKSTFHICTPFWLIYEIETFYYLKFISPKKAQMVPNLVHWQRMRPWCTGGRLWGPFEAILGINKRRRPWDTFWSWSESVLAPLYSPNDPKPWSVTQDMIPMYWQ